MKPRTALIIIDMQRQFKAANDETTISNVIREVRKAKKLKQFIILVEYGRQYTISKIRETLKGYKYLFKVTKDDDDGSYEIIKCILKNQLGVTQFNVCGVNTSYCVHDTVEGLCQFIGKIPIRVIKDACNCEDVGSDIASIRSLKRKNKGRNRITV